MILLLALLAVANAHVPAFDTDTYSIEDKSWGIYKVLEAGDSFSVFLDVPKGKNISFSVSLAGSQKYDRTQKYLDVSLYGHNASDIVCDPKFTGWGYKDVARRLHTDALQPIPYKPGDLHFELFGVGMYRTVAACQGKVPVADDKFNVTVKALVVVNDNLRVSIGAGMEESFTFLEILMFPITITRTWFWDNFGVIFVFAHAVSLLFICVLFYEYKSVRRAKNLVIAFLLHSVFVYIWRFIFVTAVDLSDVDDAYSANLVWGLALHIIVPFVVALSIYLGYR